MKKIILYIVKKILGLYLNILSYFSSSKALQLSYAFFTEPNFGKLNISKLPEILKEAKKEVTKIDDDFFQTYIWEGNNNKVLLLHGWESNAGRWEKLIKTLKKSGSTIIAIDAPGHGLSSGKEFNIPLYAKFINSISNTHQPNAIIGHSMGALAASYYQFKYNQNSLEKIVLLGSPSEFQLLLYNFMQSLGLNDAIAKKLKSYIELRFDILLETFSSHLFLQQTTIFGLIAHDLHDNIVPFTEADKIAAAWKNAKFIKTKYLGHSMHDDQLNNAIDSFLNL